MMHPHLRALSWLLLSAAACCPLRSDATSQPTPRPSAPAPYAEPANPRGGATDPVREHADAVLAAARAHEPEITEMLLSIAKEMGGEMVKLEHRLKTRESTMRKIRTRMVEDETPDAAAVVIDDALRYTMRVDDEPPGRYLEAIRQTLATLEQRGHVVETVRNYWPTGDNYSGVNCALFAPSRVPWELQFHTSSSFATQTRTRDWYEEMRLVRTPIERKRVLFDSMTAAWADVPVPLGVLGAEPIHPKADERHRPRP